MSAECNSLVNVNRGIESSQVAEYVLTMGGGDNFRADGTFCKAKKVISLKLDIFGEALIFHINICTDRAKLADIVPIARVLCDKITDIVLLRISSKGASIPCGKGCSTCCKRCLVPLSVPEVFRFKEDIVAKPASRRESIWEACLHAARLILKQKPPESLVDQPDSLSSFESAKMGLISNWYSSLNLNCPFLHNNACSIYEQRPLACREHFIKGSSSACSGQGGIAEVVEMPVQLPNVLGLLASELEGKEMESVILPLALIWYQENPQRAEKTWPAEMMVKRFAEIVESMAQKKIRVTAGRKNEIIDVSKKRRAANQLCRLSSG